MSLTRSFLSGMGLTDSQVSAIIEAHAETVDALKVQRDNYKESADNYEELKKSFDNVSKELNELKAIGGDWQSKYEEEHSNFESYKKAQSDKEIKENKVKAYTQLLLDNGVSEKRISAILKVTDIESIELNQNGELRGRDKLSEGIKSEWADFITSSDVEGAKTPNPPENNGGSAFENMSLTEKMNYANEHPNDVSVINWLQK